MELSVVSKGVYLRAFREYLDALGDGFMSNCRVGPRRNLSSTPTILWWQRLINISDVESKSGSGAEVARVKTILAFVGGTVLEMPSRYLRVEWPNATPWLVFMRDIATGLAADLERGQAKANLSGECVVGLSADLVAGVDWEEVLLAMDMQRRKRLRGRGGDVMFTSDDAFVEDVKLRALRFLQRELEASPWALLVRSLDLPAVTPSDDELLEKGPSFGGDAFIEDGLDTVDVDDAAWAGVAS